MAKDAELERLKAAQDTAFKRKQDAYDKQESAWKARAAARETMNSAFEAKQRAYDVQQRSWEDLSRLRDREGPRIEQLNRLQEQAYQNMKDGFDQATAAHNNRDGAAAAMYAQQGHGYKAESQRHVAERRGIINTLKAEADRHATLKPAFDAAKDRFNAAKREHDRAKAVHERAQAEFKTAKANFDKAAKDFKARLEVLKKETGKRNEDKRSIAEKAGVPYQYRDKVYVSKGANGITNIYFGGVGEPNGPGHAHYVMDASGKVTYKREPFDPHGNENFVRDAELTRRLGDAGLALFRRDRSAAGPRSTQYHDGTVTVKVKSGYNRKTNSIATDLIIIDRSASPDEHLHLILDELDGTVLFEEWRKNH